MKKRNLSHCQVSHRELCFLIILNAARLNSSGSENLPAYVSSYWVWGAASDEETDYVQLKALIQSFRCSAMTRRFTARVRWNNSTLIFLQDRIYDALTVPRRSKFRKSCLRSRQVQVSFFIMSPLGTFVGKQEVNRCDGRLTQRARRMLPSGKFIIFGLLVERLRLNYSKSVENHGTVCTTTTRQLFKYINVFRKPCAPNSIYLAEVFIQSKFPAFSSCAVMSSSIPSDVMTGGKTHASFLSACVQNHSRVWNLPTMQWKR